MGRIRRGNFVFVPWTGDHGPRHVLVFRNGELVVRWDMERHREIDGRVRRLLAELQREGRL